MSLQCDVPANDSPLQGDFLPQSAFDRSRHYLIPPPACSFDQHALQSTDPPALHSNKLRAALLTIFAVQRIRPNAVQRLTSL